MRRYWIAEVERVLDWQEPQRPRGAGMWRCAALLSLPTPVPPPMAHVLRNPRRTVVHARDAAP